MFESVITRMNGLTKRLAILAVIVGIILCIPLIAMQFTSEVNWTLSDFIFAAVVLFGAGLVYELVSRKGGSDAYKVATFGAVATSLLLVWVNAAVGIIGDGPVNMLYIVVLLTGMIGTYLAHLKPHGMSLTLFAMAVAQMAVPTVALLVFQPPFDPGVLQVFYLNAIFALLFIGSGLIYRRAT